MEKEDLLLLGEQDILFLEGTKLFSWNAKIVCLLRGEEVVFFLVENLDFLVKTNILLFRR